MQSERAKELKLAVPTVLSNQIAATAAALGASLDKTMTVLLRYGLAVQKERESANNRLGEIIFGK